MWSCWSYCLFLAVGLCSAFICIQIIIIVFFNCKVQHFRLPVIRSLLHLDCYRSIMLAIRWKTSDWRSLKTQFLKITAIREDLEASYDSCFNVLMIIEYDHWYNHFRTLSLFLIYRSAMIFAFMRNISESYNWTEEIRNYNLLYMGEDQWYSILVNILNYLCLRNRHDCLGLKKLCCLQDHCINDDHIAGQARLFYVFLIFQHL